MRLRLMYFIYAGLNAILIAAALAFAIYVSGAQWVVSAPNAMKQQHDGVKKQLRLRRGPGSRAAE